MGYIQGNRMWKDLTWVTSTSSPQKEGKYSSVASFLFEASDLLDYELFGSCIWEKYAIKGKYTQNRKTIATKPFGTLKWQRNKSSFYLWALIYTLWSLNLHTDDIN